MKYNFLLLLNLFPFLLNAQILLPLEESPQTEVVTFAKLQNNHLISQNSFTYFLLSGYLDDEPKETASFTVRDLETKKLYKQTYYSKQDSVNGIFCSVDTDKEDTLYYIRFNTPNFPITPKQYYLVETDYQLSFMNEYPLFQDGNEDIEVLNFMTNAFIRENSKLIINGYRANTFIIQCDYLIGEVDTIIEVGSAFFHEYNLTPLDDSIFVRSKYNGFIDYYDYNFSITKSISYDDQFNSIGLKGVVQSGNYFFAGTYNIFPPNSNSTLDVFSFYKHKIYSENVERIYEDTLSGDYFKAANNISTIDTNYIYAGINLESDCLLNPLGTCDSEIRLYSINSQGVLNWKQDFGGDANHFLWHIIATQDTGVLALFYRYDENNLVDTKGDMYWIKFNKDGSQDLDYLSDFTEVQVGIDDLSFNQKQVNIFPNPASAHITFQFDLLEKEENLLLYNSLGQLARTISIPAFTKEQKIDISGFSKGIYLWRMSNGESGKFVVE